MKKAVLLCAIALSMLACSSKQTSKSADGENGINSGQAVKPTSNERFAVLKQSGYGGREVASNVVITSQSQLETLYKELNLENTPNVDFNKHNVVALFLGQKSSGGHSISIKDVSIKGNTASVQIITSSPQGNATMALTQPYCIASIAKTDNVIFK